jgi:acyl-coenzyme A thioesterase PaaI-like protein
MKNKIDATVLYQKMQLESEAALVLPPPSFTIMQSEIIEYNEGERSLTVKIPVLEDWLNPYQTMQGGFINAAIDNAVGPLSLLVAPVNMTRTMETKFLKSIPLDAGYIYVHASLDERRKKRLTFDVTVEDDKGDVFSQAKVVNFVL